MWLAELNCLEEEVVECVEHVLKMSLHSVQVNCEMYMAVGWTRINPSHVLKVSICVNH